MKILFRALMIGVCAQTLSACASLRTEQDLPPCSVSDNKTLTLSGKINQDMLSCVKMYAEQPIQTVVLNSSGGSWSDGLAIAEVLAGFNADMIVETECNSSCANYFIPVARSIRLNEDAYVALHGSLDEGLLKKALAEAETEEKKQKLIADHQNHLDFLDKYDVPKGWFFYRDAKEYEDKTFGKYLEGDLTRWDDIKGKNVHFLLVEESFIKSCLKNVHVYPFENTMVQKMYTDKKLRKKVMKQGFYPTGTMRCKSSD